MENAGKIECIEKQRFRLGFSGAGFMYEGNGEW